MFFALFVILALLMLAGHAGLWVEFVNHVHATALPRWCIRAITLFAHGWLTIAPLVLLDHVDHRWLATPFAQLSEWPSAMIFYVAFCALFGAGPVAVWFWGRIHARPTNKLKQTKSQSIDLVERLGHRPVGRGLRATWTRLPGNETFRVEVNEKEITLPRLPPQLDGLSIVHLSDLHFTGTITRAFYDEIIRLANELDPDLVAVTGDLLDKRRCIEWIPHTLGKLRSRHGVYVILGNHDLRVRDLALVKRTLASSGLINLGGRFLEAEICGESVLLAGNELPWIAPAADMTFAPSRRADGRPLRILLSHSPDQFAWAKEHDFDLMLAGHTHGGQIRFPIVGPIVAPSRHGAKYASGTFYESPTLMHVSRGVTGLLPVRYNCPPELTRLVLRTATPLAEPLDEPADEQAVLAEQL